MTTVATASSTPDGVKITLQSGDNTEPRTLSPVALVEEFRQLAARTPSGEVQAIIQNLDDNAKFREGAFTIVAVDTIGTTRFRATDHHAWEQANASSHRPAPVMETHELARATETGETSRPSQSGSDAIDQLFTQSFIPDQTRTIRLPEATIVTANTKGGAAKTTVAIAVVAAAAHMAGHNDLALIDVNPSGNLAEHTISSAPANIINLAQAAQTEDFGQARTDLDPFVNWQPGGWLTITCPTSIVSNDGGLISDLDDADINNIIRALRHHCRLLLFDTGNNAKDPAWQTVIGLANKILVPVQWDPDTVIEAQKMITNMAAVGHTNLKQRILFVGTHAPNARPDRKRAKEYRQALEQSGWNVMDLPPDKHLAQGGVIEWDKLRKRNQEAAIAIVNAALS